MLVKRARPRDNTPGVREESRSWVGSSLNLTIRAWGNSPSSWLVSALFVHPSSFKPSVSGYSSAGYKSRAVTEAWGAAARLTLAGSRPLYKEPISKASVFNKKVGHKAGHVISKGPIARKKLSRESHQVVSSVSVFRLRSAVSSCNKGYVAPSSKVRGLVMGGGQKLNRLTRLLAYRLGDIPSPGPSYCRIARVVIPIRGSWVLRVW